jgi:uncharacterized membrane protein YfhO
MEDHNDDKGDMYKSTAFTKIDMWYICLSWVMFILFFLMTVRIVHRYHKVFSKYSFVILIILNLGFGVRAITILACRL